MSTCLQKRVREVVRHKLLVCLLLRIAGAVVSSVAGGSEETDNFNIKCETDINKVSPATLEHHRCTAVLYGFDGRVLDAMEVDFETTQTVTSVPSGSGGGSNSVVTNQPVDGTDVVDLVQMYVIMARFWHQQRPCGLSVVTTFSATIYA